jgi:hypothetical protein
MSGNIFAFGMIGMLAGTLVLLAKAGSRPNCRSCLWGVLAALIVLVLASLGDVPHFCHRGGSDHPALLAGPLAGLVCVCVRDRTKAWLAVVALGFSGFALCIWATEIVHHAPYVGNPKWSELTRHNAELTRRDIATSMINSAPPGLILPPGWIDELWEQVTSEASLPVTQGRVKMGDVGCFWHTWFTGLYRLDEYKAGFWCPGGPISEGAKKLELRQR